MVLLDWSSGKRTLETRLMKGVPGRVTDCQDEIESGFSVREVELYLSERRAGGIAVGCADMNDMVRNKRSFLQRIPRKCLNKQLRIMPSHADDDCRITSVI